MDKMILERAQAEIEADVKKKEVLKAKTLAAKAERDRQMREVKNKIEADER
jgi:ribonuclease HII